MDRWRDQLHMTPDASMWAHHEEFAGRTQALAGHLRSALLVADERQHPSALALVRTGLEHHLLDRLLLLADRYEQEFEADLAKVQELEQDFAAKTEPWTRDVVSIVRTRRGLRIVRAGHPVRDADGNIVEHVSPYWVAVNHYDAFAGRPEHQAATSRPFWPLEDQQDRARRNQKLYSSSLKWQSICNNLALNQLMTADDLIRLEVHYSFLSPFTHGTISQRDLQHSGRVGGPPLEHVLGELVLLYVVAIALAEIGAWEQFVQQRPGHLQPLDEDLRSFTAEAAGVIAYLWFLGGAPSAFDRYQEANRRAAPQLLAGERPTAQPDGLADDEVGYYSNPIDRLTRMHMGENEMMTGFSCPPAWPARRW